jgi:hypothetical protein
MPDDALKPALRAALRFNEIGNASPYKISFAGKAKSGGSFGFMQGDLAAHLTVATRTFHDALAAAGVPEDRIQSLLQVLSVPCPTNPLTPEDTTLVDNALLASRALVDRMDETILQGVYGNLDRCSSTANSASCAIEPVALIYMALWINMTGPPTSLLRWLSGQDPGLTQPIPPAGDTVDEAGMQTYLQATAYFTANPRNFPHLVASAEKGAELIPTS